MYLVCFTPPYGGRITPILLASDMKDLKRKIPEIEAKKEYPGLTITIYVMKYGHIYGTTEPHQIYYMKGKFWHRKDGKVIEYNI